MHEWQTFAKFCNRNPFLIADFQLMQQIYKEFIQYFNKNLPRNDDVAQRRRDQINKQQILNGWERIQGFCSALTFIDILKGYFPSTQIQENQNEYIG